VPGPTQSGIPVNCNAYYVAQGKCLSKTLE
jgi:hypothetical protein